MSIPSLRCRNVIGIIVHEVCKAIVDCLLDKYIPIPRGEPGMEVVRRFEEVWHSLSALELSMAHTFLFWHLMAVQLTTTTAKGCIQLYYKH